MPFEPAFDVDHAANVFPPAFDESAVFPPVPVSRYFTTFDPSVNHYISIPTATATGDFEVTLQAYPTGTSFYNIASGADTRWNLQADNTLSLLVGGVTRRTTAALSRNQFNTVRIRRISGSLGVTINSQAEQLFPNITGTVNISEIARRADGLPGSQSPFAGIISNVNFISGFTQEGNPTGNPEYRIDEDWVDSNVVANSNATLGSELIDNPNDLSSWSAVDVTLSENNGVITATAVDGTFDRAELNVSGLVVGDNYVFEVEAAQGTIGTDQAIAAFTFATINDTQIEGQDLQSYRVALTATAASGVVRIYPARGFDSPAGSSVEFTNASLRQAPGYGTAENITSAAAERFTLNTSTTPNQWENADGTRILRLAQ